MTAPVVLQPGQRVELDITAVAFGGDGIGRLENFVVFVPFVVEGERVEAEIVEVRRRYAFADLVRVLTPSPHRVTPRCPYYARCAGCQYQHIAYTHQLELKRRQIADVFQRLGGMRQAPIEPVVASPLPYGYRNKLVVHGPGQPGFWTVRGRSIIAVDQCPIACAAVNARLAELSRAELANVHVTVRANAAGQAWCYEERRGRATEPEPGESPTHPAPRVGSGHPSVGGEDRVPSHIEETLLNRTFRVPLRSFFQVNRGVIERALEHVRAQFRAGGCRVVVDAYCGVGIFALMLADLAEHVYGIEVDRPAIDAAVANAAAWGLTNTDFYPGQTERLLYYTLRQCDPAQTCLILDPPRSGCGRPVLKTLREVRPRQVIYISCAPDMLARDLKELCAHGYRLERVTPFDMFPQTQHCEAVAVLANTSG